MPIVTKVKKKLKFLGDGVYCGFNYIVAHAKSH